MPSCCNDKWHMETDVHRAAPWRGKTADSSQVRVLCLGLELSSPAQGGTLSGRGLVQIPSHRVSLARRNIASQMLSNFYCEPGGED